MQKRTYPALNLERGAYFEQLPNPLGCHTGQYRKNREHLVSKVIVAYMLLLPIVASQLLFDLASAHCRQSKFVPILTLLQLHCGVLHYIQPGHFFCQVISFCLRPLWELPWPSCPKIQDTAIAGISPSLRPPVSSGAVLLTPQGPQGQSTMATIPMPERCL